ncbi:protein FAM234A [Labrus mixtus]|uniref:protein FAM234A n=1 Tax=Labrus mixtus TaxID=508554 RepID=UPI0029C097F1|nr:protein FAM234A [Labrus mixtus]XP_060884550.1 protein FAM234A [Labrus mixtus]XP_060884551.1 protein FAM234A [Labrus mixtus]XP_060884552.1 protein FAM234A [Labrus mixtus]XP_060884553.1 protein FAM234A [Labrus mixtus]XP_060884554.1 protein FAM234A [Labrus mixtus]XP_060884555.1 protein FAM234A [Labrus mixtus]XP_060884556.1 protein FAM234A [Labrus mixtus]XP_060884557.1 protein FAM234A [Labrus mixtus]XP_060884558.1 protein FAM234A [Labrus mixtus]
METTGSATEGDPLKRGEDGAESGTATLPTELKKKSCKEAWGLSKLTHWRTGVFFFSLFLCLTVVFAFSFIIPCPVRPQYLLSWNRTFSEAATYDFIAIEDASKDKVMDVLFVIKNTEGSQNNTCADAGLPSPCVFLLAVDGTDGESLWERPLDPEYHWAQCGLDRGKSRTWDCLLSHSDKLTAVDKFTGEVRWQQPQPPSLHSTVPVLSVPDLDGDQVSDVALVAPDSTQTQLVFLSGKTGAQIGSTVSLDSSETANHLLHCTSGGSHYVLVQKDTGVYGLALWRIAAQAEAGMEAGLKKDKHWEKNSSATTGFVPVYKSDSVKQVLRVGETGNPPNLLIVTGKDVALIDGKSLKLLWRFNTSSVLSEPSFGHYNKDDVLDVVLEEDVGNSTKRVLILDGKSGGVLWEVNLLASPNSPRPASIHTANSFSIFVFWGQFPPEPNSTVPVCSERCSYMLHPLYSKVLLESNSSMDHFITFKATLLERGRHAAYILLTGPGTEGAEGTVVLSKRKLKQDVPISTVHRIGTGGSKETNNDIKEAFNRLRFSEW